MFHDDYPAYTIGKTTPEVERLCDKFLKDCTARLAEEIDRIAKEVIEDGRTDSR